MVQSYVRPDPGLDLQPYVERQVWIQSAGTVARFDGTQCIKAAAVSLSDRPATALRWLPYRPAPSQANAPERPIRQTAYEEPAAKSPGERIPAPQPIPSSGADAAAVPEPAQMPPVPDYSGDDGPDMMPGPGPAGPCGGCPQRCGPQCGCPSCRCCCPVAPYWVGVDTLLWWTRGMETPALVTSGPSASQPGYLNSPGTVILAGGGRILDGVQAGGGLQVGMWLNDCGTVGFQGDFLALGGDSYEFNAWSSGNPILARPFFDTAPTENQQNVELVAEPGVIAGNVNVAARTWFEMAGVDFRVYLGGCEHCWSSPCDPCTTNRSGWRLDMLLGYRYLRLQDRLDVTEGLTSVGGTEANPTSNSFYVQDGFATRDQFNGGEVGLLWTMHRNRWSLEVTPRLAFGTTHETVSINGSTVTTDSTGASTVSQGGLLALPTNIGNYSKNELAVVPQIGLTLGYQLTPRLQATFGYSFLYWSRVARAGDQIDFNVDDRNIPPPVTGGGPDPKFTFNQTSFWAQGLNFGLNYHW